MEHMTPATTPTTRPWEQPPRRHGRSGRLGRAARWRHGGVTVAAVSVGLSLATLGAGPASAAAHAQVTKANMVTVEVKTVPTFGKILVTQKGLPLYYDAANKPGHWACSGACLTAWPPLLLPKGQKAAEMGKGVSGLGSTKAPYGTQVTWDGKALYTFIQDSPGTVTGNDVHDFYVVQLSKPASAGKTTTTVTSGGGGY